MIGIVFPAKLQNQPKYRKMRKGKNEVSVRTDQADLLEVVSRMQSENKKIKPCSAASRCSGVSNWSSSEPRTLELWAGYVEEGLSREIVLHICRGIPLRLQLSTALCMQEALLEPRQSKLDNFLGFTQAVNSLCCYQPQRRDLIRKEH